MDVTIQINSKSVHPSELKSWLESQPGWNNGGVTLHLKERTAKVRGLDPIVLVAIVSAASTALGALITGLFQWLHQSSSRRIVIESASGDRLEFPADLKPEEIDALIERVGKLGLKRITLD